MLDSPLSGSLKDYDRTLTTSVPELSSILAIQNFEQFFLIGISPNKTQSDSPQVLIAYPPYQIPELNHKQIIEHALPYGTNRRKVKSGNYVIQEEFTFALRYGESEIYGTTAVFYSNSSDLPFFMSKSTKNTLFAFVILSRIPTLSTHFSFLTYLVLLITGGIPKFKVLSEVQDLPITQGPPIPDMEVKDSIAYYSTLQIPENFSRFIHIYHKCIPGMNPMDITDKLKLHFQTNDDTYAILYTALDTVCSILEPKMILDVLSALYLDYQILVIGSCLEEVSLTVLAFVHLIDPMKYSGIVMPVLPQTDDYLDILQAPTPYIIGTIPSDKLLKLDFLDTTVFVNLDTKTVETGEDMPHYPNAENIAKELKKEFSEKNKPQYLYAFQSEYLTHLKHKYLFTSQNVNRIVRILRAPLENVTTDFIYSFFVTDLDREDSSTIFNRELFLMMMPQEPFFKGILSSQTFEQWTSQKLDEFMILKGEDIKKRKKRERRSTLSVRQRKLSVKVLGI
ncbi:hypothetical protein TVAG_117660 [Trichomonas vaginalis G3]|uniref:UDENN domain-containing protein n=1 Tax=Trichomonas vaginalis (strain ATCC PRA-98 / G3) TaxID=412133 RepID=A2G8A8_TRIV3|nr:Rab guanyl-nucleotide exchange factor protein [Trichomonas vaginalis G3]EAX86607.1 hypothetical protein TVAG_117660 [Trichomonas vaginalis G3]KAI5539897.1 Rab guanyl-nucleotide exchange factor protein [Trichomonas vaginalis G3]|eukprot:XP_001299537.1 hypothetical protein [Trichomonas vaginalis G3]